MTIFQDFFLLFYLLSILVYLSIALLALRQRDIPGKISIPLFGYLGIAVLGLVVEIGHHLGWLGMFDEKFLGHIPAYTTLLLAWLLGALTLGFLRTKAGYGWLACLAPILAVIVLDSGAIRLPQSVWKISSISISWPDLTFAGLVLAWSIAYLAMFFLVGRSYLRTPQPLHRNRLKFWAPLLVLCLAADAIVLWGWPAIGTGVRLAAALALLVVASQHQLPDVRRTLRQVFSFAVITLLTLLLYTGGYILIDNLLRSVPGYTPILAGAIMAVLIAFLFNPLLRLIQKLVNRLLAGARYDPAGMVQEYSQSISNILEMERLAATAVEIIQQAMGASKGCLYLVNREIQKEIKGYDLAAIKTGEGEGFGSLSLAPDSAIIDYFCSERLPLTQYDLDLHPKFKIVAAVEKAWFQKTGMDVYVPVLSKDEWIGLFMFGPKLSRDRYFDEDLALLSTMAGQTAVALENARLVSNLVHLNKELQNAYHELGQTNQKLEKLDKTKSDFISIASHELRTPLTLLVGYGQMLVDDPVIKSNPYFKEIAQGILNGTERLHEIVGSMLDMVMIDTRTLKLDAKPILIAYLMRSIVGGMESSLAERRLTVESAALNNNLSVEADHEALEKVFYHLINNAVKFTPDEGKITITAHSLSARVSPLQVESVEVVVADTGIGIDPQFQDVIFAKFYQTGEVMLHSTSKTNFKGGGPGLGLAIVRGIIEAHHGKVWVESRGYDEKDCPGSQFHVVLPVKQAYSQPEEE